MCRCTPSIKTPFCGAPGCEWPHRIEARNAERTGYEAFVRQVYGWSDFRVMPDGSYCNEAVDHHWHTWRAAESARASKGATA